MEALKQDLLSAKNTPNVTNTNQETSEDTERKLLQGEEVIGVELTNKEIRLANKYKQVKSMGIR